MVIRILLALNDQYVAPLFPDKHYRDHPRRRIVAEQNALLAE
jgi:hypothetical protein